MNKTLLLITVILFTSCYKKKYQNSVQENQEQQLVIESLEVQLYAEKSSNQAQANAYKHLENSYLKIMEQLVEINREFNLIEERESDIKGFERELTEFASQGNINHPLAYQVKDKLEGVIEANKRSIERNKTLLDQLESMNIDNKALKDAIQLFKTEIEYKDKLIANNQKQIGNLEETIQRLNSRLDLQKSSCEDLLAEKNNEIINVRTEVRNLRIQYDACQQHKFQVLDDLDSCNQKLVNIAKENIILLDTIVHLKQSKDSIYRLNTEIPDCALAYFIIGSIDDLLRNRFLIQKGRGYEVNEDVMVKKANKLNYYFSSSINLPNATRFEIIHSKSKKGFTIRGNQLIIQDKSVFLKDKFLVIYY